MPRTTHVILAVSLCALLGSAAHAQDQPPEAPPAKPLVPVAASDRIVLKRVACDNGFDCWLAELLFPESYVTSSYELTFEGTTAQTLESQVVLAVGELGNNRLDTRAFTTTTMTLPTRAGVVTLPLLLFVADVPADHYVGTLRLQVAGYPVTLLPLDLSVRSGPLWPLIVTVLGILVGLGARYWSARGQRQAELLKQHALLAETLARTPELQAKLAAAMRAAHDLILRSELDQAEQQLTAIRAAIEAATPTRNTRGREALALPAPASHGVFAALKRSAWLNRRLLGPTLRVVAFVGVTLVGLRTLYVIGGGAFGSNKIFDLLVLFGWGVAAEVSTRKLTTLGASFAPPPPTPEPAAPNTTAELKLPGIDVEPAPAPLAEPGTKDTVSAPAWPHRKLHLDQLYADGLTGANTTIAVLDSGVRKVDGLDWSRISALDATEADDPEDRNGHGTEMVGILASKTGVCPAAKVVSIRVLDSHGEGSTATMVKGIDRALALKCDVISISAGQERADAALDAAVARAYAAGVVVVGATRKEAPRTRAYPAACAHAVAVTPSKVDGHLVYDNPGTWVTIAAPGERIPTYSRDGSVIVSGSSPAAAITAGVCALLLTKSAGDERRLLGRRLAKLINETGEDKDGGRLLVPEKAADELQENNA